MRNTACWVIMVVAVSLLHQQAFGGDRDGVSAALGSVSGTWPDALFSIDVTGASDGEARLGQRLEIGYEAAVPGYLAYLRVSSHGDLTLYRNAGKAAKASGKETYVAKAPLGSEQLIVLFANAPWDALFPHGGTTRDVGGDRDSADGLVQQLAQLTAHHVQFAARRYELAVSAMPGGTEYTTRGIIRQVEEAKGGRAGSAGAPRIPSRIEFEFDSDRLTAQGKLDLDTFGEALVTGLRDTSVALEGHTDALGTDDYNQALSERRAQVARQYLVDGFGLSASRLSAVGMGKSNPVASNDDPDGRSHNRRVDFLFSARAPAAAASDGGH
jgi:outer membrane protein OmpA-like peptidoglycan-associated protein